MGCDIHVYTERKIDGIWKPCDLYKKINELQYKIVPIYRNRYYVLFGILAGVRGQEEPLHSCRGIPEDVSDEVRTEYESDPMYFCATWYTLHELELYYAAQNKRRKQILDNFIQRLSTLADQLWIFNSEDMRVVMFFDT